MFIKLEMWANAQRDGRLPNIANGPKFTILSGHVDEVLLLNKFFSDCRYMPQLRRYSPTKLYDGAQIASFWRFFLHPAFPASRVQHVSDLHPKFSLRHTMCGSMANIQSPTTEIRREKKTKN